MIQNNTKILHFRFKNPSSEIVNIKNTKTYFIYLKFICILVYVKSYKSVI